MKDRERRSHPVIEQQAEELLQELTVQQKSGAIQGMLSVQENLHKQKKKAYLLHEVYSNAPTGISDLMEKIDLPGRMVFFEKRNNPLPQLLTEKPVVRTALYYDLVTKDRQTPEADNGIKLLRAICCETGDAESLRFFQYTVTQKMTLLTPVRTITALDWMNHPYLIPSIIDDLFANHIQGRIHNPVR